MIRKYFNREISWLSFNYRVLQEANDKSVPLYERIKFLAIYSSNLDEFYRVRVASLRSLLGLKKKSQEKLSFDPKALILEINSIVQKHQKKIGEIFMHEIIHELNENHIHILNENELSNKQNKFLDSYYQDNVLEHIQPLLIVKKRITPFLKNNRLYLVVRLSNKPAKRRATPVKRKTYRYALVEIPSNHLPRFVELPSDTGELNIIFLDDVIRLKLKMIFNTYIIEDVYSIKLTRDAEIYIEDEFSGNLLTKIMKGLRRRNTGVPSRFLYDKKMDPQCLKFLKEAFLLEAQDLVPGGKYHNFHDFFSFPFPKNHKLVDTKHTPIKKYEFEHSENSFSAIAQNDISLFFPYHSFDYVLKFLNDAADDPDVTSIKMTQYRVAVKSQVVKAMIRAAHNGKKVMVFVELKARFDEESNIHWAEEMDKAGITVFYSFPGLKVHSKIALVSRLEHGKEVKYGYFGTGNFNEHTAKIYSDFGLFTTDLKLTTEAEEIFKYLSGRIVNYKFQYLLVAHFNMRKAFIKLIDKEISIARKGGKAKITLKMNSLEDTKMINKLYDASDAGVKVRLIIRGICCLIPGVAGMSENIKVISIVDQYLEHTRFFVFHNNGKDLYFAGSADWMRRNLNRRVEVIFPIFDSQIKKEIQALLDIQFKDNSKARFVDTTLLNNYVKNNGENKRRSQSELYHYFKNLYTERLKAESKSSV